MIEIPDEYRQFWELVERPPQRLIHITSASHAAEIIELGAIQPKDPNPRDWEGLVAVFMADPKDPSFAQRLDSSLAKHFTGKSTQLEQLTIETNAPLFRCVLPNRASYYASPLPIATAQITERSPFRLDKVP